VEGVARAGRRVRNGREREKSEGQNLAGVSFPRKGMEQGEKNEGMPILDSSYRYAPLLSVKKPKPKSIVHNICMIFQDQSYHYLSVLRARLHSQPC